MSNSIIQVKDLSKRYKIAHEREAYLALRDKLAHPIKAIKQGRMPMEDFWALKDIDFEIQQGEVVGIIGPNGSGKSTLLKILSQITPPTTGEVVMRGRVASLLEVGTGFHPELTGRENMYLSGIILGMSKAEIKKHFDEIVEFAGVEKFLDTPVKRYSSGMLVRLGFAVAAHLESEILIVDEVLAVGDAEFQKKCLGKMNDITKNQGRTIIFVSHDMGAIETLCQNGIFLKNGKIVKLGAVKDTVAEYMQDIFFESRNPVHRENKVCINAPLITSVKLTGKNGQLKNSFTANETIGIELTVDNARNTKHFHASWYLSDIHGKKLAFGWSFPMDEVVYTEKDNKIICELFPGSLVPGRYILGFVLFFHERATYDNWFDAIAFEISTNMINEKFEYPGHLNATQFIDHKWIAGKV
ncbi:MAG: polysaccharide ABC transporter ATP-binding protein [Candidatus Falkowbacteria bacterium]